MDSIKLSILIPTLASRQEQCLSLVDTLLDQVESGGYTGLVEVVTLYDKGEKSIGTKRNELIQMSKGEYIAFFDDDDVPSSNYINELMSGISLGVDCCSLKGVITWDGSNPKLFEHSLKYKEYRENTIGAMPITYERMPNHLNCIKKSLIFDIKFPEISHGEDTNWSYQVFNAGVLKTEYYIDSVIYHYKFVSNK